MADNEVQDAGVKAVEEWAKEKGHTGVDAWNFAAAKAYKTWPVGFEVTEEEYDNAVTEAGNLSIGYAHKATK